MVEQASIQPRMNDTMHKPLILPALLSLALLALPACSSIDRSGDLQNHTLSAKTSRKTDVVNAIGLPAKTQKDAAKGLEFWFYTGKPISSSYFVPMPVAATPYSPGLTQVFYADLGAKNVTGNDPVALIAVFDSEGRLVDIYNPSARKR